MNWMNEIKSKYEKKDLQFMKKITFYTDENKPEEESLDVEDYFCNLVANKYLNREIIIRPMFTVPLLHIKMSNWEDKKQKLIELFNLNKKWLVKRDTVNTTYLNENDFENVDLRREFWDKNVSECISNIFNEERKIIYEMFGNPNLYPERSAHINYAWFQEQKNGMFHGPHTHGVCGLSAVCFIEYDKNQHTPTIFLSPYLNPTKGHNEEYSDTNVSSGSLLVFPSNIVHFTQPNNTSSDRIILALNINV